MEEIVWHRTGHPKVPKQNQQVHLVYLLVVQVLKHVIRGDHPLRQTPVQAEPVENLKRRWIVLTWHHELALHVEIVEH